MDINNLDSGNKTEVDISNTNIPPAGSKRFYLTSLCLSLCFSLVAALLYTLAFIYHYNADIKHFENGSIFIYLTVVMIAAALLSPVVCAIKFHKKIVYEAPKPSVTPPTYTTAKVFISSLCGFMFAALGAMQLIDAFTFGGSSTLQVIRYALTIPTSAYFFFQASGIDKASPFLTLLGFIPDIYFVVSLMSVYFSNEHALNSPHKILAQMLFVSLMLFFTAELRFPIDRASLPRYLCYGCASITTLTLTWLPQIYSAAFNKVFYAFNLLESVMLLALTLYIAYSLTAASHILITCTRPADIKSE